MNNQYALKQLTDLRKQIKRLDKSVIQIMSDLKMPEPGTIPFDPKQIYLDLRTNQDRLIYLLELKGKFLHATELSDLVLKYSAAGLRPFNVSPVLGKLKKDGRIVMMKANAHKRNSFWGLSEWLDQEGNIKPEHKYDEDKLFGNK